MLEKVPNPAAAGLLALLLTAIVEPSPADEPPPGRVDFAKQIRPILAERCHGCHGASQQKSGLRLDRKADAMAGGDLGPAIVPGKPDESELLARVSGEDETTVMPPKGDRLSEDQVRLLRDWIASGAEWPEDAASSTGRTVSDHWAFRRPQHPRPPEVRGADWARNPIDRFILGRLESEGVAPSPEAERTTLIRRLSLDLLGLPPRPEDVEAFVADERPDAYERLVDRLLASPQFGERWGRHWLDLARFADSDGYEKDSPRPHAYRYRDWVIDAFNRDLPFDQFTIQQLAGDLLPDADLATKTATGFHRNTLTNREGGVDPEEFRVKAVVDRVNTTGTVWLGLTIGCAQCHTHKYDPILQREYYGLYAFFNTGQEVDLTAPLPTEVAAYERAKSAFDREHEPLEEALRIYDREERPRLQRVWEREGLATAARWVVLRPAATASANGADLAVQPDGSITVSGTNPESDTYTISAESDLDGITAFRLEVLDDPNLPSKGPGRVQHGNFVLSEFAVAAEPREGSSGSKPIPLADAKADFSQDGWPAAAAVDRDLKTGWAIVPRTGQRHVAAFEVADGDTVAGSTRLTFRLDQQYGERHTIGRFRLSATTSPRPVPLEGLPDEVAATLAKPAENRSATEAERLAGYHRSIDPGWKERNAAVEEHAKKAPKPPESKVNAIAEEPRPRKSHILIRGDFLRPGDEVRPHTPEVLPPLSARDGEPDRLDFARWLVSEENPLTARVEVNRIWGSLFGRPLVGTTDDFGTRGEVPNHPELLDWLACEFRDSGWSRKSLIRTIVLSAAYRQSSRARSELRDRDPNNAWLARQNRFRVEAEVVRDLALAASGLLSTEVGGPSVRPPQPPGISELTYADSAKWVESRGGDRYRRGLYTWFQRTSPYPMLMTFDAPDANVCAARRERSNTPLQALTLLNDAVFMECAQSLARRLDAESRVSLPADRIRQAFQIALGRDPSEEEARVLLRLFEAVVGECRADPSSAAKLSGREAGTPEEAALVVVARAVLNLDEFVTRE
jgi:mono/diheme cytochrome c family protein